jgi:eukaryotic-like serine/threonine-protein kinase
MAQAIKDLSRRESSEAADSGLGSGPSWVVGLEDAATSFQELRRRRPTAEAEDLERWCADFPGNPAHAQLFRDLHAHDPDAADRLAGALKAMPSVGVKVAGFVLVGELGRGAFGRVFLARQGDLANRHVVLKISTRISDEAQTLARLHHPHIVPVYSVHRCPPFQAVCMPYLGASTLEDVLKMLQKRPALPDSGQVLVATLRLRPSANGTEETPRLSESETVNIRGKHAITAPPPPPSRPGKLAVLPEMPAPRTAPAVQTLPRLSYVEAVLWLAARLADGLAHAHETGVVHRDLKPANVLLTDDGQPMLLDFNIAADAHLEDSLSAARLGGTLPYMAPEQLAAFHGRRSVVDARSDLYSFGIILYELLTGRHPFPAYEGPTAEVVERMRADRRMPPPLRPRNQQLTPAVEVIVRRCLEPDPAHRYQKASDLREDLERHLAHLPLRHVAEPSLRGRAGKWVRRHPRLAVAAGVGALAAVLLIVLGTFFVQRGQRLTQIEQRQTALEGLAQFDEERKTAQFLLYTRLAEPEQRDAGLACCARALSHYQVPDNPDWQQLPAVLALPDEERQRLREAISELLLLQARAVLVRHREHPDREQLHDGLRLNRLAMNLEESAAVYAQQAEFLGLLGVEDERAARARSEALPPRTARDHYWLASEHLAHGRTQEALPLLQQATRLEPANYWAWFVLGNCHDRLGEDVRAEACYATCITLAPDSHWAYFNRGLAFLRQKDYAQACADFDEVLRLRPDVTEAWINRAQARQGLGRFGDAVQDLTEALERGAPDTRIYFLRSRLRAKLGDAEGAKRDREEGLRREPCDEKSWVARGFNRLADEPQGALADFEQALRINPNSVAALQNKAHVLAEKLGRTEEAVTVLTRLLELHPGAGASRSGRGVLRARLGRRDEAIKDGEDALLQDATPPRLYQVACIYALTSRQQPDDRLRALQLLSSALARGYGADLLPSDNDLDPLRDLPEFRRLRAKP